MFSNNRIVIWPSISTTVAAITAFSAEAARLIPGNDFIALKPVLAIAPTVPAVISDLNTLSTVFSSSVSSLILYVLPSWCIMCVSSAANIGASAKGIGTAPTVPAPPAYAVTSISAFFLRCLLRKLSCAAFSLTTFNISLVFSISCSTPYWDTM